MLITNANKMVLELNHPSSLPRSKTICSKPIPIAIPNTSGHLVEPVVGVGYVLLLQASVGPVFGVGSVVLLQVVDLVVHI